MADHSTPQQLTPSKLSEVIMSHHCDFLQHTPLPSSLAGRIIVITGAGSGIGKAISLACAEAGATVVLLGRTMAKLEVVYDAIEKVGAPQPAIFPINFESATTQDYQQLKSALSKEFGKIDGLLHNAAMFSQNIPISQHALDDWAAIMQVNVTAPLMLTQYLLPLLKQSEDASVVFTGADSGYSGRAYWGAYGVSKAACENLMQVLAEEFSEDNNIRFNSVNPGATRTALRAKAFPAENPEHLTLPEQHANQYLYLLSAASKGVSGKQFQIHAA